MGFLTGYIAVILFVLKEFDRYFFSIAKWNADSLECKLNYAKQYVYDKVYNDSRAIPLGT